MEAVFGNNVIVEMFVTDDYYPVLCATDCEFRRTPEIIEKTTTTSGLFKEFAIRREEWEISVSGLTKIENDTSLSFFYMLQSSVRRQLQDIRITFEDNDGNNKQIQGDMLIGEESISASAIDFANGSIFFKGSGEFSITAVSDPPPGTVDIFSDYWIPSNGNNYVDGNSVVYSYLLGAGDELLEVDVEGTQFDIITSGSPGNRQCKLNTTTYVLYFATDQIFDGTQKVYIEFKRT